MATVAQWHATLYAFASDAGKDNCTFKAERRSQDKGSAAVCVTSCRVTRKKKMKSGAILDIKACLCAVLETTSKEDY